MTDPVAPQTVVLVSQKSSAPLILGIIGFILYIPGIICNVLCASVAGAAASSADGGFGSSVFLVALFPSILSIGCFILCFFGKSPKSTMTGVLMIVFSSLLVLLSLITFNFWGLVASVCYLIGGILSITNTKKA